MQIIIEISRQSACWSQYRKINSKLIKKVLGNVIDRFECLKILNNIELSILLTNDAQMSDLNFKFRDINQATNVLSFPDTIINPADLLKTRYFHHTFI